MQTSLPAFTCRRVEIAFRIVFDARHYHCGAAAQSSEAWLVEGLHEQESFLSTGRLIRDDLHGAR
jgi:hypothetical protein